MNVLIVENSNYLSERIANRVKAIPGVKVCGQAASVKQAIAGIGETQPDAVLLDIRLDQGSGYEVLEQVKRQAHAPIVIVLTNYAYPQYREKYLKGGADYFFDKSNELDQALVVLRGLSEKKINHWMIVQGKPNPIRRFNHPRRAN